MINIVLLFNSDRYEKEVTEFLESVSFNKYDEEGKQMEETGTAQNNLPALAAQIFLVRWDYQKTDTGAKYRNKSFWEKFPYDKFTALIDK